MKALTDWTWKLLNGYV